MMENKDMELIIQLKCTVREDPLIGGFVSLCPALEVYSQGSTFQEALEAIKGAVFLKVKHAFFNNRLDMLFHEAINKHGQFISVEANEKPQATEVPIVVPFPLVANAYASHFPSPV